MVLPVNFVSPVLTNTNVKNKASSNLEAINRLLATGTQAYDSQKQIEIQEQTYINQDALQKKKDEEALKKATEKALQSRNVINFKVNTRDLLRLHPEATKDLSNPQAVNKTTEDFNSDLDGLFNKLSVDEQKEVVSTYISAKDSLNKNNVNVIKDIKKQDFIKLMKNTAGVITSSTDPKQREDTIRNLNDAGILSGLSKDEIIKTTASYLTASIKFNIAGLKDEIFNSLDVSQLDKQEKIFDDLIAKHPEYGETSSAIDLKNTFNTIRRGIKGNVDKRVLGAIATQDKDIFNNTLKQAFDQGLVNTDEVQIYNKKFIAKGLGGNNTSKIMAQSIFTQTGGKYDMVAISDPELRKNLAQLASSKLSDMVSGRVPFDMSFIRHNVTYGSPKFKEEVDTASTYFLNKAVDSMSKTKDGSMTEETNSYIQRASNLVNAGGSQIRKDTKLKVNLGIFMLNNGYDSKNIKETMNAVGNWDDITTLSSNDKGIQKIREEVPSNMQESAKLAYSALLKTGNIDPDILLDTVIKTYNYDKIDGLTAKTTTTTTDFLSKKGFSVARLQDMETVLKKPGFLPEEDRQKLVQVFGGEDPAMEVRGNGIYISNKDGNAILLNFNDAQYESLSDRTNEVFTQRNKAGAVKEFVNTIAESFGKSIYKTVQGVKNFNAEQALSKVLELNQQAGEAIYNKVLEPSYEIIKDASESFMSELQVLMSKRGNEEELKNEFARLYSGFVSKFKDAYGKKAGKEINELLATGRDMLTYAKNLSPKELVSLSAENYKQLMLISTSGGGSSDKYDFLQDILQKESPKGKLLVEGAIHTAQEGNPTTNYGINLKQFPKLEGESDREQAIRYYQEKVEPRLQHLDIKGVDKNTLVPLIWNVGANADVLEKLNGLDLTKPTQQEMALKDLVSYIHFRENGNMKWSKGLLNARIDNWNSIIGQVSPTKKIRFYLATKNGDTTIIHLQDYAGNIIETRTNKPLASSSNIEYGKMIAVQ